MNSLSLAVALALCGCITPSSDPGPGPGGWGSGYGGGGGPQGFGCEQDADCGGGVCARDGECLQAADVRTVHVSWTVNGAAASTASCASSRDLDITFDDGGDQFGFSPVPCDAGRFTVDKLPTWYSRVTLARVGDYDGGDSGVFDATGNVALDLPY